MCEAPGLPGGSELAEWVSSASREIGRTGAVQVSIRVVDEDESQALNREFRGRDKPTNVLSFPSELDTLPGLPAEHNAHLGDLVLCAPVVRQEALAQGKPERSHWLHLVLHGFLHLNGYDHETDEEAEIMEALETRLLAAAGLPDPYKDPDSS